MADSEIKKVVVIGGGGHSHSVCDILLQDKSICIAGVADSGITEGFYGLRLLGGDECLQRLIESGEAQYAFAAVGSNRLRKKLTEKALSMGYRLVNAVSPRAWVSPNAVTGNGTAIMAGAVINGGAVIGSGAIINTNCSVDHDTVVGDYVHIAPGCAVCGTVRIGELAFLGVGCSVIDGISIGSGTVIGAGAAVVKDIPAGCTAVGVPARVIKSGD